MDPPLAPTLCGLRCPLAPPSDHWYGGLGVSLGDFEACKPQKVGGCGWNTCPWTSVLSHVAQDTARSWFWTCLTQTAHIQAIFGHFWAVSWTYCGARGQRSALGHGAIQAHVECSDCFSSFIPFGWLLGLFSAKNGFFGAQNAQFWEGTYRLGAPAPRRHQCVFDQFLTLFWWQHNPFLRPVGIFHGPKLVSTGSKWAKNTCLSIPNGPRSLFEKRVFDPFLTHFCSQNGPFSRHFGIFHGPKRVSTGTKWAKNTCLSILSGPGTSLKKLYLSPRGPWWTHPWPQPCAGRAALRLHQVTTVTGV